MSRGKSPFEKAPDFRPKIEDFRLKGCIFGGDSKNKTSARTLYRRPVVFLVFLPGTRIPLFFFLTLFSISAAGTKRSPLRRLPMMTLVRKLTTLLKSPGSTFPQNFATLKALLVIPASSAALSEDRGSWACLT